MAEWMHPVRKAFFPAISISLLLIAVALSAWSPGLARLVWLVGAVLQVALMLGVISGWIGHNPFQTLHISPAWFIPAVGNVVAPLAGVPLGFVEFSWFFFSAGMIFWMVLLTLVMNRLIFHDPLPGKLMPTLTILIAPPAVGFLAWVNLNGGLGRSLRAGPAQRGLPVRPAGGRAGAKVPAGAVRAELVGAELPRRRDDRGDIPLCRPRRQRPFTPRLRCCSTRCC